MLFIRALFSKIQTALLLSAIVYSLTMTALYVSTQKDNADLTAKLQEASQAFTQEVEARTKDKKGYEQDIALLNKLWDGTQAYKDSEKDLLSQLEAMDREEGCIEEGYADTPTENKKNVERKELPKRVAKLADSLSADLSGVLESAYQSGQGSSSTAKQ